MGISMVVIHRQTLGLWLDIGIRMVVLTMNDAGMNRLQPIINKSTFGFVQKWWSYPHFLDVFIQFYPLVNVYITMENHHLSWLNQL